MEEVIARKVRFLSIDPGSRTLGLAVMEFNFDTGELTVLFTMCLDVDEGLRHQKYMEDLLGTRLCRINIVGGFIRNQLREWKPSFIIMETPYMGSHAQAFKVLVEIMRAIELAVEGYSVAIPLLKIDPSTVKKTIGVPGNSGDKGLMLNAVKKIVNLVLTNGISLDLITEHEVDAIAVGNYAAIEISLAG